MQEAATGVRSNAARGPLARAAGWFVAIAALAGAAGLALESTRRAQALVVAGGGLLLAIAVAAGLELKARSRLRAAWLDRLHELTERLAAAAELHDPAEAVREASARARDGVVAPRAMEPEREAFLRSVGDLCAQAADRLDLLAAERRARSDLELLARASPLLAASLDAAHVAATVESLVVPDLADRCVLRVLWGPTGSTPGTPDPPDPGVNVVALSAEDQVVGELEVARTAGPMSAEDLQTVRLLSEPAARALAHALRFTDEAHASATLQRSLLPTAILPVPGLELATRYLAATEGQAVGGDFYDAVRRPDGTVVLVVGDVQGKGIEAAALTSAARHTLRSAALDGAGPADMLARLNHALLYADAERTQAAGDPHVRFVTAAVVALRPTAGGFSATVASGGHPPPLVIRPDGAIEQVHADGPLLGVFDDAAYEEIPIELHAADLLVLYTDGVTERRRHPEVFDEVQLGRLVRNQITARQADAVAQLILDTVVEVSPREVRDDIALVVARVTPCAAS